MSGVLGSVRRVATTLLWTTVRAGRRSFRKIGTIATSRLIAVLPTLAGIIRTGSLGIGSIRIGNVRVRPVGVGAIRIGTIGVRSIGIGRIASTLRGTFATRATIRSRHFGELQTTCVVATSLRVICIRIAIRALIRIGIRKISVSTSFPSSRGIGLHFDATTILSQLTNLGRGFAHRGSLITTEVSEALLSVDIRTSQVAQRACQDELTGVCVIPVVVGETNRVLERSRRAAIRVAVIELVPVIDAA